MHKLKQVLHPLLKPDAESHPTFRINDELALARTRLANERTNLAYLRTGLALVIAGLSLINFFRNYVFTWIGAFFIPFGLGVIGLGWVRFRTKSRRIEAAVAIRHRRHAARSTT